MGPIFVSPALFCFAAILFAVPAHATTYYVTVAGLGGEPDYEQRFGMWAGEIEPS